MWRDTYNSQRVRYSNERRTVCRGPRSANARHGRVEGGGKWRRSNVLENGRILRNTWSIIAAAGYCDTVGNNSRRSHVAKSFGKSQRGRSARVVVFRCASCHVGETPSKWFLRSEKNTVVQRTDVFVMLKYRYDLLNKTVGVKNEMYHIFKHVCNFVCKKWQTAFVTFVKDIYVFIDIFIFASP